MIDLPSPIAPVAVPTVRSAIRRHADAARGFTLIEVLIVVAIVGILAAIAYPSYAEHVKQTRRTDAQLSLLSARQAMERCRSTSYTYAGCPIPSESTEKHYDLTVEDRTATAFTLVATVKTGGAQAGDDACRKLTISHLDVPGGVDSDGNDTDACWN